MDELRAEEVNNLFGEFKQILRQGKTFSAVTLDAMIERTSGLSADHDFLNNLRNAAKNIDSIPDYLFAKYKIAENQPEDEREGWSLQEIYSSVEEELNELMGESRNASDGRKPESKNDEEVWMLIVWSAELWFLFNLQKCKHDSVKRYIKSNAIELFHEFFDSRIDSDEPHFDVLAEKDCVDIMEKLLCPELGVSLSLQKYFDKKGNVKKFCKTLMRQNMIRIVKPHSKKFYIIPRPSDRNNFAKMYGIIVCGFFKPDQPLFFKAEQQAATAIEDALDEVNIDIIHTKTHPQIFESENLFTELRRWVGDKLSGIENRCSLLILTILCHGKYGHLAHKIRGNWLYMEIEELLKLFETHGDLKGIPKVIAMEACQMCWVGSEDADLQKMIENYDDAMLLISCAKDQQTYADETNGFLINLAKELEKAGFSQTLAEMFLTVSEKYIEQQRGEGRTVQPVMFRSESSKEILIPRSITGSGSHQ